MTKADFLKWLGQFRRVGHVKTMVEERAWSPAELDRLKETLVTAGGLEMKNEYRRRMAWG